MEIAQGTKRLKGEKEDSSPKGAFKETWDCKQN